MHSLHIVEPFHKVDTVDVLHSLHIVEPFYKVDTVETRHLGTNTYSDGSFRTVWCISWISCTLGCNYSDCKLVAIVMTFQRNAWVANITSYKVHV